MDSARLAELLRPFTGDVSPALLDPLRLYLDLLLRWNARMNLTAVRDPEQIVSRHFGESLFTAKTLLREAKPTTVADVGSGAGFPGIPLKLWTPQLQLTLIESQGKKATFLREAIRTLNLAHAEVFCGRAEDWGKTSDVVTLRAVEQFERVLPTAVNLVAPGGRLCLLISARQVEKARELIGQSMQWLDPVAMPGSERVVAVAMKPT